MGADADQELSSIDRIRDAAIDLFGEHGFRATSLRSIADAAGVSQALIIHHYDTKQGLRTACDQHVTDQVRSRKKETVGGAAGGGHFSVVQQLQDAPRLLRYLTRAMTEGGEHTAALIDDLLEDALEYMEAGERAGMILPSRFPRDRAAVLLLWSLGALTLHEQVSRLLDVDLLAGDDAPESLGRYFRPALELYSQGLITEQTGEGLLAALPDDPDSARPTHDEEH